MAYSVGEDVKRWMRAGVLDRFKLLSPPDGQPAHKLWEALPPLPATLLSHGGVVRWSRERAPLLAGALLHLGTWPSLAAERISRLIQGSSGAQTPVSQRRWLSAVLAPLR
jgi:hypothetical protein